MNNIAKPSTLPVKSDYHLFRYGIKPEWEDPQNRGGGKSVDTASAQRGECDHHSTPCTAAATAVCDSASCRRIQDRYSTWWRRSARVGVLVLRNAHGLDCARQLLTDPLLLRCLFLRRVQVGVGDEAR